MKRLFIFGIGGTGCRVLRSLNFMLAAGVDGFDSQTQVFPIIIDYDKENADKERTLACIENYSKIHDTAFQAHQDQKDQFFMARMRQMKDALAEEGKGGTSTYELNYAPKQDEKQYKDSIGYEQLTGDLYKTQFLLESLYDTSIDPDKAELAIDMTVGFKGNPNIGSVVFHELKKTPEYKDFVQLFNPETDSIMIVGSLFGGTGSSGIPELITAIRNSKEMKLKQARLGAIMVLPYFSLISKPGSPINSSLFNSKTKAALSYYEDSGLNENVNAIYYVGDSNDTKLDHNIGGKEQLNRANFVEFVAAMSIIHFVTYDPNNVKKGNAKTEYFKYAVEGELYGANGKSCIDLSDLLKDKTVSVIRPLCSLTLAMKYFHDCIEGDKKSLSKVQYFSQLGLEELTWDTNSSISNPDKLQDICYYLHEFYEFYKSWLDELNSDKNGHQLKLFNLATPTGEKENYGFHRIFAHKDQTVEKGGFMGGKKSVPTFVKQDMDVAMNNALTENGHFEKGKTLKTPQKEYVLLDILRTASNNIMKDNTNINI